MDAVKSSDSRDQKLIHLMQRYELSVKRMCCAIVQDAALAEDAAQETFLRAYRALDGFRSESSEKTWLMRIAINVCKDMRRSGWFRFIDRRVDPSRLPEPAACTDEQQELSMLVMQLPRRLLEVVLLYYYQGMTTRETAAALGIPQQTVVSRLQSARKRLRISLEGDEPS